MKYKNVGKQCLLLLLVFMINGCMFRFSPKIPPMLVTNTYSVEEYQTDRNSYITSGGSTILRDKMIFSVAGEIDKSYMKFRNSLFRGTAAGTTALQMTQIGLTSAATLAGGEAAKSILAAIATGTAGSALSFGKNFFKEKSSELLISRMDALRAQKWSLIYTKITGENTAKYTWYEAERDLVDYFWAGSVQAAIQSIFLESGVKEDKAREEIKKRIVETFSPTPALAKDEELKNFFKELNPTDEGRAGRIIEEFQRLMPQFNINPPEPRSRFRDLIWLGTHARNNKKVRDNLIEAFKAVPAG